MKSSFPKHYAWLCGLALSLVPFGAVATSPATYHNIAVPGALSTQAMGVNNKSQIVGGYEVSGNGFGFILSNGKYQKLEYPGGQFTSASSINDSGEIVGSTDLNGAIQGFVLNNGTYQEIAYPGYSHNSATGVNNAGVIVGNTWNNSGESFGFKYVNGQYSLITFAGANYTEIGGINNKGDISGTYFDGAKNYGFILHADGKLETIWYPGQKGTSGVTAINDMRQVLGTWSPSRQGQTLYGFLDSGNMFTKIAYPGAIQTMPTGINNAGIVVGTWSNQTTFNGFWVQLQ